MKNILLAGWLTLSAGAVCAQNTWTQKTDFGGVARNGAFGFAIGTKGYIGSGTDGVGLVTDFWEWDQATDTWTQKASTPGPRQYAGAFVIGTKGYMVMGWDGNNYRNDLWEYNPATNSWSAKTSCPAPGRYFGVGFAIGTKGYAGMGGGASSTFYNDLWEWDQATDSWTQKASYPGAGRWAAAGFAASGKGYIGAGLTGSTTTNNDFWEWDPATNTWTQRTSIPGMTRCLPVTFAMGSGAFLGLGSNGGTVGTMLTDFYYFDPYANSWTPVASFPSTGRISPVGFTIGTKGYVGTGYDGSFKREFWEYAANYVSVPEYQNDLQVTVFPNPSTGLVTMNMVSSMPVENATLNIHDSRGALVKSITGISGLQISVNLEDLAAGAYTYSLQLNEAMNRTGTLIIQ